MSGRGALELRRLHIERLPGIGTPYEVELPPAGIHVIHGPNASGKSSLARAFRALLYAREKVGGAHELRAELVIGGEARSVERIADHIHWYGPPPAREPLEPPPLPAHRHVGCFAIGIEELVAESADERALAERVALELAGGFDLPALREAFRVPARHGRRELREVRAAAAALNRVRTEHGSLRREADELAALSEQRAQLERGLALVHEYENALRVLQERYRRRELEGRLAAFPAHLARLLGNEGERLQELREQLTAQRTRLAEVRERRGDAEDRSRSAGYPRASLLPAPERLHGARERLRAVERLAGDIDALEVQLGECDRRERSARAELGAVAGGALPDLSPETLHEAERELAALREHEAELRGVQSELSLVTATAAAAPPEPELERLRRLRDAALDWLAAPVPPQAPWAPWGPGLARWTVLAGALGGAVIGAAFHPGGAAALAAPVVGLVGAAAAVALWFRYDARARREQGAARTRLAEQSQAGAPHGVSGLWPEAVPSPGGAAQRAMVRAALSELDARLAGARAAASAAEAAARRRAELQQARERLDAAVEAERSRLAAVAGRVGFQPLLLDASFERWLRLTRTLDREREERETLGGRRDGLQRQAERDRAALVAELEALGAGEGGEPRGVQGLADALAALERRAAQAREAHGELRLAVREEEGLEREIEAGEKQIRSLFAGIGLSIEQEVELMSGLNLLAEFKACQRALDEARVREADALEHVGGDVEIAGFLEHNDEEGLRRRIDEGRGLADQLKRLTERIIGIEQRTLTAREGDRLQEAGETHRRALDELEQARAAAQRAAAVAVLLDDVEREHRRGARPRVMEEAEELFGLFTRHRFGLGLGAGGESTRTAFHGIDNASGHTLALGELSVGTRMQLLLALRIAFARALENGGPALPLFVDEALATADPERFAAVAGALGALCAREGRQVIYLTAHPYEVAQWRASCPEVPVHVVELAAARRHSVALPDWAAVRGAAPEPPPSPEGLDAAAYAERLSVPRLDPWRPGRAHPLYLYPDDLDVVHRLLGLGLEDVGTCGAFARRPAAVAILGEGDACRLRERVACFEAYLQAWREGRGRPLAVADLADGAPVTATFFQRIAAEVDAAEGDAGVLLGRLEGGAVKGFGPKYRARLREWLEDEGFVDPASPAAPAAARERALELAATGEAPRERLVAWMRWLEGVLPGVRGMDPQSAGGTSWTAQSASTR